MNSRTLRSWTVALGAVCAAAAAMANPPAVNDRAAHPNGIWKAAVPPLPMRGEFDNYDPLGIAARAWIKADCSLNWVDPDDGKRYCFASGTSLEVFLDGPQANLERARQVWQRLSAPGQ